MTNPFRPTGTHRIIITDTSGTETEVNIDYDHFHDCMEEVRTLISAMAETLYRKALKEGKTYAGAKLYLDNIRDMTEDSLENQVWQKAQNRLQELIDAQMENILNQTATGGEEDGV